MNKVLFIIFTLAFSANNHPIILIHGFLGWGRDEMSNYYYWGGTEDYEQKLKNLGYEVKVYTNSYEKWTYAIALDKKSIISNPIILFLSRKR